jgi:hypothetical protein
MRSRRFAQRRDVVPVLGIDCDLGGGAERDLVARYVILDADDGQRRAALRPRAEIHERSSAPVACS